MPTRVRWLALLAGLVVCTGLLLRPVLFPDDAQAEVPTAQITGYVIDSHNEPVEGADIQLLVEGQTASLSETATDARGLFSVAVPSGSTNALSVRVEHAHFRVQKLPLTEAQISTLSHGDSLALGDIVLERQIGLAFWLATITFVLMLIIVATERLHNTLAALTGVAILFASTYLGGLITPDLFVFSFARGVQYVDWNVIFLILGMMIYIAVVERTGVFQWLAFFAYRISRGKGWLLMPILVVIASVLSALLDNVTTMLLMAPFTVQIALTMEMNPLALLIPEALASNVAGTATLIGTPTNILIGSAAKISFGDFLVQLAPGVVLSLLGLIVFAEILYAKDLRRDGQAGSPALVQRLRENARIVEPVNLKKAGWVGLVMLVLFVAGDQIHLVPAVTALIGATALMVWIGPNVEEMIEAVDWTTLVFFIALFIVVGGIEEVGLISKIADLIRQLVGQSLILTVLATVWLGAFFSGAIDNIPFTAAMLPVVSFLTATVPGADNKVLFFSLAIGASYGGNATLIGSSPNLVTAGVSERAGYPITYVQWLKKGIPVTILTAGLGTLWLFLQFLIPS